MPKTRTDSVTRTIDAPALSIYSAMIHPDVLETWLAPDGLHARLIAFDPRPGGHYRLVMHPVETSPAGHRRGEDILDARFLDLVPGRQVVQSVGMTGTGAIRLSWLLSPAGEATEVTIRAEHVPETLPAERHRARLSRCLEKLDRHVTGYAAGATASAA